MVVNKHAILNQYEMCVCVCVCVCVCLETALEMCVQIVPDSKLRKIQKNTQNSYGREEIVQTAQDDDRAMSFRPNLDIAARGRHDLQPDATGRTAVTDVSGDRFNFFNNISSAVSAHTFEVQFQYAYFEYSFNTHI